MLTERGGLNRTTAKTLLPGNSNVLMLTAACVRFWSEVLEGLNIQSTTLSAWLLVMDVFCEHRKSRERLSSANSTGSREESFRKRSPSWENDRFNNKRRRHDSENSRGQEKERQREEELDKEREACHESAGERTQHLENGVDNRSMHCSCGGKRADERKALFLTSFYEDEPRM